MPKCYSNCMLSRQTAQGYTATELQEFLQE